MKIAYAFVLAVGVLSMVTAAGADTLTLKNGDHLTGTVVSSDGKQVTLKTDYAGDMKIQWSDVQDLNSTEPLYVVTPDHKTVNGNLTLEGTDLVVHTASAGEVRVPLSRITVVRSAADEQAYENSLHPSLLEQWKGGIDVGFALARGNSDTTNLNTAFTADRKTLSDEIGMNLSSIYATSGATASGGATGVTANEILGGVHYNHNISKSLFAFVSGDFTHDALQDLDVRAIYSAGLGWHAINTPVTTLDLLGGVNYTRESYSTGATATSAAFSVGRNLPGLTVGENLMHKFGASTALTEQFIFYPDLSSFSQYRFSLDSGVVTKINRWLGWQTSLSDRYVTNPPIFGTKSNDVILSTGLNVAFGRQ
ncbi:MAG: DUF481 domain-containing protein [Candidatus Acidiferrales bacterium]